MVKRQVVTIAFLLFSGCSQKLVTTQATDFNPVVVEPINPLKVKVVDNNVVIPKEDYVSYVKALRSKIDFYEQQVLDYLKLKAK